jgi:hypothetical protein
MRRVEAKGPILMLGLPGVEKMLVNRQLPLLHRRFGMRKFSLRRGKK